MTGPHAHHLHRCQRLPQAAHLHQSAQPTSAGPHSPAPAAQFRRPAPSILTAAGPSPDWTHCYPRPSRLVPRGPRPVPHYLTSAGLSRVPPRSSPGYLTSVSPRPVRSGLAPAGSIPSAHAATRPAPHDHGGFSAAGGARFSVIMKSLLRLASAWPAG